MSIVIGRITVRSNRLVIGDATLPPRGTLIERVPNGTFDVTAETRGDGDRRLISGFGIRFADRPGAVRAETFSIDSGVVGVADPSGAPRSPTWLGRRRERWDFVRRIMAGVANTWYVDAFMGLDGAAWAVVFRVHDDDIYPLRITSDEAEVIEISATILR